MHMTTLHQQSRQMRKETARRRDVDVVQQAIDQNKIESFVDRDVELRGVCYLKTSAVPTPSIAYISFVPVDSYIVGMREVGCIGPWATSNIQHSTKAADVGKPALRVLPLIEFGVLVGMVAAPFVLIERPELITLITNISILSMLAISFDLCWGYSGIMSFGQALFFGVPGYVIALFGRDLGFSHIWAMLPLVLCMCVSTIYGRYHYVADIFGGVITGTLGYFIGGWLMRRSNPQPTPSARVSDEQARPSEGPQRQPWASADGSRPAADF